MYFKYITLFVFLSISLITAGQLPHTPGCTLDITQTLRKSWDDDGSVFSLYDCIITNTGEDNVTDVEIKASSVFYDFWGLTSEDGTSFYFPDYVQSIDVGHKSPFSYIVNGSSPAEFTVTSVTCDSRLSKEARDSLKHRDHHHHGTQAPTEAPTHAPTAAPTHAPTAAPTHAPTAAPTHAPTSAPTAAPTHAPTAAPTHAPTSAPTAAPTHAPTAAPTHAPTSVPTAAPTHAPTSAPTAAPTHAPTSAPTSAPAAGGRVCPAGTWWAPGPLTTWQWQLTGTVDTTVQVQMIDIDLFDNDASVIQTLHNGGKVVICYFSTQYENWRPDSSEFTAAVIGNALDDWPGENYVDIRSTVVRNIMTARMDLAVTKGCDGLEPDNVDGYEASTGFPLTAADQLDFNEFIAAQAHQRFLSVALKNDLDQASQLAPYFDFAINEQCNEYDECNMLTPFTSAGKAVFNCEYSGSASSFCPKMVADDISTIEKDLNLDASIAAECCTYASGGCAAQAAHTCVTAVANNQVNGGSDSPSEPAKPQEKIVNSGLSLNADITFILVATAMGLLMTVF